MQQVFTASVYLCLWLAEPISFQLNLVARADTRRRVCRVVRPGVTIQSLEARAEAAVGASVVGPRHLKSLVSVPLLLLGGES